MRYSELREDLEHNEVITGLKNKDPEIIKVAISAGVPAVSIQQFQNLTDELKSVDVKSPQAKTLLDQYKKFENELGKYLSSKIEKVGNKILLKQLSRRGFFSGTIRTLAFLHNLPKMLELATELTKTQPKATPMGKTKWVSTNHEALANAFEKHDINPEGWLQAIENLKDVAGQIDNEYKQEALEVANQFLTKVGLKAVDVRWVDDEDEDPTWGGYAEWLVEKVPEPPVPSNVTWISANDRKITRRLQKVDLSKVKGMYDLSDKWANTFSANTPDSIRGKKVRPANLLGTANTILEPAGLKALDVKETDNGWEFLIKDKKNLGWENFADKVDLTNNEGWTKNMDKKLLTKLNKAGVSSDQWRERLMGQDTHNYVNYNERKKTYALAQANELLHKAGLNAVNVRLAQ